MNTRVDMRRHAKSRKSSNEKSKIKTNKFILVTLMLSCFKVETEVIYVRTAKMQLRYL